MQLIRLLMGLGMVGLMNSCDSEVQNTLDFQYEGDKIALSGFLSPDSVHVLMSRSVNPSRDIQPSAFALRRPQLFLLNDQDSIIQEISSSNQRDFRWGPANLIPGKSYRLRAVAEGLVPVETDWITIPQAVEIKQIDYKLDRYANDTVYRLSFHLQDLPGKDYFAFYGALQKGQNLALPFILVPDEIFRLGCYSFGVFNDRCFAGQGITLTYLFFQEATFPGESAQSRGEAIVFRFGAVSEQAYLQSNGLTGDDGIIEGLNEPPLTFSNVRNGYGMVFAYNIKSYLVPLP